MLRNEMTKLAKALTTEAMVTPAALAVPEIAAARPMRLLEGLVEYVKPEAVVEKQSAGAGEGTEGATND